MQHQFSETAPGGTVSGRRAVRRQAQGLVYEYGLQSTATERVAVRLSDRVPADAAEDFGFHREHEPASWTLSDGELEMTVELAPGDERTVVLGVATDGSGLPDDLAEPGVDLDVGRADDVSAAGTPGDATDDGDAAHREPRVDADGGLVDAARGAAGGVVSRLVDELEAGTVPESELDALRGHLGTERDADEQARLDALADELEAISRRQDELADRIDDLAAAQATHADTLEALEAAHEEEVSAVRADLERREETVGEELAALRRDLEADLAALEREVEAFESTRRALVEGFRQSGSDADATGDDANDGTVDGPTDDTADDPADAEDTAGSVDATATAGDGDDDGDEDDGDEDDPDDVFIPPSRLDEVSGDADADEPAVED